MSKDNIKKVVLAYSGGRDTSIIIPWLKENYNNPEIIAVAGNVGQADELEGLEEKAIKTGASKLIVADLVDEMVDEIIIPSLKMDAKYETYLLGTAFARPIIGRKLAQIALEEGADAVCHHLQLQLRLRINQYIVHHKHIGKQYPERLELLIPSEEGKARIHRCAGGYKT